MVIDLSYLNRQKQERNSEISLRETREIKPLRVELAKAEKRYQAEKEKVHNEYCEKLGIEIYSSLFRDYNLMLNRRNFGEELTPKEIKEIQDFYEEYQMAEGKTKDALEFALKRFLPSEKDLFFYLQNGQTNEKRIITTFAGGEENHIYLISPTNNTSENPLIKSLEDKLYVIFGEERISFGADIRSQKGRVDKVKNHEVNFNSDIEMVNGFQIYTLGRIQGLLSHDFLEILGKKIYDLQPKEFKTLNLEHNLQVVPSCGINYFLNNDLTNLEVSPISQPHSKRRNNGLQFESENPKERINEALERLSQYGERLTLLEAQNVLGHNNKGSTCVLVRDFKNNSQGRTEKNRTAILVSHKELEEFVKNHRPIKDRWLNR